MAFVLETVILVVVALGLLINYLGKRNHDYWKKRGVPGPKPSMFLGNQKDVLLARVSTLDDIMRVYNQFEDQRYVGMLYGKTPGLLIRDLDLVRHVLTKDFEYFPDRGFVFTNEKSGPLSANLFVMGGVRWKNLRIKLTPTFSSGKIKRMFPLMHECALEMQDVLQEPASRGEVVEMRDIVARFTTDIIGSCAFGINCNSLKNPDAEFRRESASIFAVTTLGKLRMLMFSMFPQLQFLRKFLKPPSFEKFFPKVVKENVEYREMNNIKREDFLDLLIEIKKKGKIVDDSVDLIEDPFLKVPISTSSEELKFTDSLLASQAFVFFIAGFETSSSTTSFGLMELAQHPDIQEKLQKEVNSVLKRHGALTYDAISEMHYLDKVVNETMRKYPIGATLFRKLIKPYKIPGSDLVLEPGVRVHVPLFAIHHDANLYPDPERFDPERFSPEAKAERHPYAFIPFGEGPRTCIGMRFGLLQTKLGIASIISRFELRPSTLSQYPVRFKKGAFITTSEDGCNLTIRLRQTEPE